MSFRRLPPPLSLFAGCLLLSAWCAEPAAAQPLAGQSVAGGGPADVIVLPPVQGPGVLLPPAAVVDRAADQPLLQMAALDFDEPSGGSLQPPVVPDALTAKSGFSIARPAASPASRTSPRLTSPAQVLGREPVLGRDPAWKPAFIKSSRGSLTYLPADREGGLSWTTLEAIVGLKRPTGRMLTISPRFAAHFTENPGEGGAFRPPNDVPGTLYEVSADINVGIPLSGIPQPGTPPRWIASLALSPGFFSDGQNTSGDALRTPGRALVIYNPSEHWSWVFGAVFLDREDVPVVPAVGLSYRPTPNLSLDLMLPRPKLAYRFQRQPDLERWFTISGEFAGGQWAVQRGGPGSVRFRPGRDPQYSRDNMFTMDFVPGERFATLEGLPDVLTLRAYNLLMGIETRSAAGLTWTTQFGMQFGRELEYESGLGNRQLNSTALVRLVGEF